MAIRKAADLNIVLSLLIQHITTDWTKASRGGDGARRRNAVPERLPIPDELVAPNCLIRMHRVQFDEAADFQPEYSTAMEDSLEFLHCRGMALQFEGDGVDVSFVRDHFNAAIADRRIVDATGKVVSQIPAFRLKAGQWGQLVNNGRYTDVDTGNWSYEKSIVNIALFAAEVDAQLFVRSRPHCRYVEMAKLR
jgi:hypothetical protein